MSPNDILPQDLTVGNLTPHVIKLGSNIENKRIQFLFSKLIQHCHDFVRETELTTEEWVASWELMTKVGQYCTPDRQEMILLSDILGISALVDAINNATDKNATESSVLGTFHNEAPNVGNGAYIASEGAVGEPMLIHGTVSDSKTGKAISGVAVDVWETNGNGLYDMQDPEKDGADCRGIVRTDDKGKFALVGVKSVDYPIPDDGPVGTVLRILGRNNMRPAHVHYSLTHPFYTPLTTALYWAESTHLFTDPVFGVKKSLIKDFVWSEDAALADNFNIQMIERQTVPGRGFWTLEHNFVLVPRRNALGTTSA